MKYYDFATLKDFLNPSSVAIIGVSRNPKSFSYAIADIALKCGYTGKLYLINPSAEEILGLKCYKSILDIEEKVDAAIIVVSKNNIGPAIESAIEKEVKGVVIVTSGFDEQGDLESKAKLDEWVQKGREKKIRFIGPNTLGYFSAEKSMDLIMTGSIQKGHTALIAQSGNLTQSLTFPGGKLGLGFSHIIDIGNQVDLQITDLVRYFKDDPNVFSIAIHIEGLIDGKAFIEEVKEASKKKPVFVFKSGRTPQGASLVASHTASIAGDDLIYTSAIKQTGAIQIEDFSELIANLVAANLQKPMQGRRVAILSEGGGDCVVATDACLRAGLEIATFSQETLNELKTIVPSNGNYLNPIDLAGWENFVESVEVLVKDDGVDGVLLVGGFGGYAVIDPSTNDLEIENVKKMIDIVDKSDKPILIYSYFGHYDIDGINLLKDNRIPIFANHHQAVGALANLAHFEELKTKEESDIGRGADKIVVRDKPVTMANYSVIPEHLGKDLLREYGLQLPKEGLATSAEEAVNIAKNIGFPVVLKIVSPQIVHKSDAGCVVVGIEDENTLREAYKQIEVNGLKFDPNAEILGILVASMVKKPGVEIIIGGIRDATFGPIIMFGLGGLFVEILKDVAFRVCPISKTEAREMVREIKGYKILEGARGTDPVDIKALEEALVIVSQMMVENYWIKELDLNPIKVHNSGYSVLDARILTE